jgi:hypothetical protein
MNRRSGINLKHALDTFKWTALALWVIDRRIGILHGTQKRNHGTVLSAAVFVQGHVSSV